MPWMNKLFISALAVTMMIMESQCLSFSMSQSQKRWCHPHRNHQSMKPWQTVAPCSMIHTTDGGGEVEVEVEEPVRRRWRRRRKDDDSTSLISNIDDGRVTNDDRDIKSRDGGEQELPSTITTITTAATTATAAGSSSCPIYSMKFPRYRISLTNDSSKNVESEQRRMRRLRRGYITKLLVPPSNGGGGNDAKNRGNGNNNHPLGLLDNLLRVWNPDDVLDPSSKNDRRVRKSVEAFYHEERIQGRFRWITSSSSSDGSTSGSTIAESSSMNAPDEDFHAAAAFWRMASDIVAHLATDDNDEQQPKMWYLALPETTSTVTQNLCDTLNWYANFTLERDDNMDIESDDGRYELPIFLYAEMDLRASNVGKIPIVRFTLHNQVPLQQQKQLARLHQQEQKLLLPTSNDSERRTKAWVKRVLVQYGICPFTKSDVKSGQGLRDLGVPVANIMYRHSSAMGGSGSGSSEDVYLLMADAWEAISDMVAAGPTGVSSILLSAPGFDDNFKFFAGPIFAMLETCVGAIQAEEMIGVVCFHPKYVTPDGKSWPGFGHMHSVPRLKQWYTQYVTTGDESPSTSQSLSDNEIAAGGAWQRRTPHSVINVLRAEQLEAAEGRRRTGELYGRNIRVLVGSEGGVGLEKLTEDLKREQCM